MLGRLGRLSAGLWRPAASRHGVRSLWTAGPGPLRVAIVGTGPSGFYTARTLLRKLDTVEVDMIEMLPTPFGLVRYGVAPDHPDTKNVIAEFDQVLDMPGCRFIGNVAVGKDVSLAELKEMYHAVVVAYGASGDSTMGIKGEGLEGSMSARGFVNWYNGHPHYKNLNINLTAGDRAMVVGNGNVALDVARVLLRPLPELETTDIADYALEALHKSTIRNVDIVGRRGPAQAAWTTAELREIVSMNCRVVMQEDEMKLDEVDVKAVASQRAKKRGMALLEETLQKSGESQGEKELHLRFLLSPKEVVGTEGDSGHVTAVKLERNKLVGAADARKAQGTGEVVEMPCSLLLRSVGYQSKGLCGLPFDSKTRTVPHSAGCVLTGPGGEKEPGMYVSGWLKRGPTGIIGTNIADGQITAMSLLDDHAAKRLPQAERRGGDALLALLQERGVAVVDIHGWRRIDNYEKDKGAAAGRPRVKLCTVESMLQVAS